MLTRFFSNLSVASMHKGLDDSGVDRYGVLKKTKLSCSLSLNPSYVMLKICLPQGGKQAYETSSYIFHQRFEDFTFPPTERKAGSNRSGLTPCALDHKLPHRQTTECLAEWLHIRDSIMEYKSTTGHRTLPRSPLIGLHNSEMCHMQLSDNTAIEGSYGLDRRGSTRASWVIKSLHLYSSKTSIIIHKNGESVWTTPIVYVEELL